MPWKTLLKKKILSKNLKILFCRNMAFGLVHETVFFTAVKQQIL